VNLFLLAFVLPAVYWDQGPESADALKQAGIQRIVVPAARAELWKGVAGISARAGDVESAVKLATPGVKYRVNVASASRSPWVDTNGGKIMRQPKARFYYDAPGAGSALAAAEAFTYGADAMIRTDNAGLNPLGRMLEFLSGVKREDLPTRANIGFVDDGSAELGEAMVLLTRRNLLFKIVPAPDAKLDLSVQIGSAEYPKEEAADPSRLAQKIRGKLTDEKRLVRIYGSEVVIARLTGTRDHAQLQLINYAGAARSVDGIRVRVLGQYSRHEETIAGLPDAKLFEYDSGGGATEFTIRELKGYALIDLKK
jgi:hypothetical protein